MDMVVEKENVVDGNEVGNMIESKLEEFDEAISKHHFLHIDGDYEEDGKTFIKVVNHKTEVCFAIELDALLKQKVATIIRAIETGEMIRLQGITRIVGYYSRIHNWNKSKVAELADRGKGSYKLSDCKELCV